MHKRVMSDTNALSFTGHVRGHDVLHVISCLTHTQRHPRAMSWVMGFLFCKLVTALMVSHITNDEYHPMSKTVWLVLGVAAQVT